MANDDEVYAVRWSVVVALSVLALLLAGCDAGSDPTPTPNAQSTANSMRARARSDATMTAYAMRPRTTPVPTTEPVPEWRAEAWASETADAYDAQRAEDSIAAEYASKDATYAAQNAQAARDAQDYEDWQDTKREMTAEAEEGLAVVPTAPVGGADTSICDPSYSDVCIPYIEVSGDLDCGDLDVSWFTVYGPDPHGFDQDMDGVGCEL